MNQKLSGILFLSFNFSALIYTLSSKHFRPGIPLIKFTTHNSNSIAFQLKVDQDALEKKFKTLTLISLAEQQNTLQLDVLAKELEISDPEELEEFLIDAIRIDAVKVSRFFAFGKNKTFTPGESSVLTS